MAEMKRKFHALIIEHHLIEYHDFVFPSWEEWQKVEDRLFEFPKDSGGYWGIGWTYSGNDLCAYCDDGLEHPFPYTKQGYTDACEWLNKQKRLMAEDACR